MVTIQLKRRQQRPEGTVQAVQDVQSNPGRHEYPRRRRLFEGNYSGAMPLHTGLGTRYVDAQVGTPPRKVKLVVDTGSFNMAFPCAGCRSTGGGCRGGQADLWDPSMSSTAAVVECGDCRGASFTCKESSQECTYRQFYSEGSSWRAYQVTDVVRLGETGLKMDENGYADAAPPLSTLHFGCIVRQAGMFDFQVADGILGMSPHPDSAVWHMEDTGKPEDRMFSLCFSPTGGSMVLGGYDTSLHRAGHKLQYTPLVGKKTLYSVQVDALRFGQSDFDDELLILVNAGTGTIVDSGTTDTYLPKDSLQVVSEEWEAITGEPFRNCEWTGYCMRFTEEQVESLPSLTFTLAGGLRLTLPPVAYMDPNPLDERTRNGTKSYAPRIYVTEGAGGVIGSNVMMGRDVVFDMANERIGFVEAVCDLYDGEDGCDSDGEETEAETGARIDEEREEEDGGGVVQERIEDEHSKDVAADCVLSFSAFTECDAECPTELRSPTTVEGSQEWYAHIKTRARGLGKACPDDLVPLKESRPCTVNCPAGAPTPARRTPRPAQNATTAEVVSAEKSALERSGGGGEQGANNGCGRGYGGVWGPCGKTCEQTRYKEDECTGAFEVRPCRSGDLCKPTKAGLVASLSLTIALSTNEMSAKDNPDPNRSQNDGGSRNSTTATASSAVNTSRTLLPPRRRFVLEDALAEAMADSLAGGPCGGVAPGDVDVIVGELIGPTANDQRVRNDQSGVDVDVGLDLEQGEARRLMASEERRNSARRRHSGGSVVGSTLGWDTQTEGLEEPCADEASCRTSEWRNGTRGRKRSGREAGGQTDGKRDRSISGESRDRGSGYDSDRQLEQRIWGRGLSSFLTDNSNRHQTGGNAGDNSDSDQVKHKSIQQETAPAAPAVTAALNQGSAMITTARVAVHLAELTPADPPQDLDVCLSRLYDEALLAQVTASLAERREQQDVASEGGKGHGQGGNVTSARDGGGSGDGWAPSALSGASVLVLDGGRVMMRSALTGQEYVFPSRSIFEGKFHLARHAPRGEYGIGKSTDDNESSLISSRPSNPLPTTANEHDMTYWKYPRSTVLGVAAMQTLGLLVVIVAVLFARRKRHSNTGSSSSSPSLAFLCCLRWHWFHARFHGFVSPRTNLGRRVDVAAGSNGGGRAGGGIGEVKVSERNR